MRLSWPQQLVERSRGAQCWYSGGAVAPGVVATLCGALRPSRTLGFCFLATALLAGCGRQSSNPPSPAALRNHQHIPPHHGTPVVLGKEEYHVELVLDGASGKLQAYILDGEMENFVRIRQPSFEMIARLSVGEEPLTFKAVPNNATGETVGDTSLFDAQTDWLKTATNFDAAITELNVRGTVYRNVSFSFPKGNDTDEK